MPLRCVVHSSRRQSPSIATTSGKVTSPQVRAMGSQVNLRSSQEIPSFHEYFYLCMGRGTGMYACCVKA